MNPSPYYAIIVASLSVAHSAAAQDQRGNDAEPSVRADARWPNEFGLASASEPADTSRRARNAVYLEAGGNGIVASINYERFLTEDISARAGIGYWRAATSALDGTSISITTVPLMLNYLGIGSGSSRLELGAGFVLLHMSAGIYDGLARGLSSGTLLAGTGSVAYRYAPLDGGFSFKIGLTPLISSFGMIPLPGVSVGALF